MTRRGHGEGSYKVLPKGRVRWRVLITYDTGEQERRTGTADNITAARKQVQQAQEDARHGKRTASRTLTVGAMLAEYMENKKDHWSHRTYENNQVICKRHIEKKLGHLKAAGVTPKALQAYYAGLKSLGWSGQNQIAALLSGAYKYALRQGDLRTDPTIHARPVRPRSTGKDYRIKAYSPEETQRFITACLQDGWAWPLAFLAYTGLRIGEMLALRWEDVHHETDGSTRLEVSLTRSEFAGKAYENPPKTARSARSIYLPSEALQILALRRERSAIEAEHLKRPPSAYIWTSVRRKERGTPGSPLVQLPMRQDSLRHIMLRICDQAQVPRRSPHALRHTCASLLVDQGHHIVAISAHLGHAKVSTTHDFYVHAFDKARKELRFTLPDPESSDE